MLFPFIFLYFFYLLKLNIYVVFITGTLLVLKLEFQKVFSQQRCLSSGGKRSDCKAAPHVQKSLGMSGAINPHLHIPHELHTDKFNFN